MIEEEEHYGFSSPEKEKYVPKIGKSAAAERLLLLRSYVPAVVAGKAGYHRVSTHRVPTARALSPRLLAYRACVAKKRKGYTGGWNKQAEHFSSVATECAKAVVKQKTITHSKGKARPKPVKHRY